MTLGGVVVDKLNKIAKWTVLVKYTVHEGGDFEGDTLTDRKPVKFCYNAGVIADRLKCFCCPLSLSK